MPRPCAALGALVALLSASALLPSASAHTCIHDVILRNATIAGLPVQQGAQVYADAPPIQGGAGRRRLETTAPLRITSLYTALMDDATMTTAKATFLQNVLMPAAMARWSSILSTVPVSGALFAHRFCSGAYATTPFKCAEFAATTSCGGGGAAPLDVPLVFSDAQLGADTYYSPNSNTAVPIAAGTGIANTDFAIFVTTRQTSSCGDGASGA